MTSDLEARTPYAGWSKVDAMVQDIDARVARLESLMHELHIALAVYAKDHFYRGEERLRAREGPKTPQQRTKTP